MEEREGGSKSKEKKGGKEARAGHGSWAGRGVFRPEAFTNEVRNCLQLFVAIISTVSALR